ncbi:hypothetical protein OG496_54610 [Streptomyces sp. NBC_00988]|uniref:hypothetical protein n=1 Tax=Streptomyces sp. NBC_00988 TaxID=2903704 RepID=UPI00386CB058|nr:hypothetical protein OG496_54610 [Streptomyces sp. NBC_00988]
MSNPGQLAGVFGVLLKERADGLLPPLLRDRVQPGQDRGAAGHWAEISWTVVSSGFSRRPSADSTCSAPPSWRQLEESHQAAEEMRITRRTLLELPEPAAPRQLPDHPAYQQIMAVFTTVDAQLRAARTPAATTPA